MSKNKLTKINWSSAKLVILHNSIGRNYFTIVQYALHSLKIAGIR